MKEKFEDRKLRGSINVALKERNMIWTADKADLCNKIISVVVDYQNQGYRLTLRQLYYQLVSKDWIPNHDIVYKKISSILDDLRYNGDIDWDSIEDRGRLPYLPYWVTGIPDALNDAIRHYRLNRQENQTTIVEVWTEKDAISGILKRVTEKYHVRLCVNKGYTSSPAIYQSYCRFIETLTTFENIDILYLGDHDSSGLDMVRDIRERLIFMFVNGQQLDSLKAHYDGNSFMGEYSLGQLNDWVYDGLDDYIDECGGDDFIDYLEKSFGLDWKENNLLIHVMKSFRITHVGLTMEQIIEYNPPPNPAKITDPRAAKYIQKYGAISWEVDALKPRDLERILGDAIENVIDVNIYEAMLRKEKSDKEKIKSIVKDLNQKDTDDEDTDDED